MLTPAELDALVERLKGGPFATNEATDRNMRQAAAALRDLREDFRQAGILLSLERERAERAEARVKELEAERDALRADAERYRWLRDISDDQFKAFKSREDKSIAASEAYMDAAIAALKTDEET